MSEQTHLVIAKAISDLGNITLYTAEDIGSILYPRTAAEIAAGVTPVAYQYPVGHVHRYGAVGDDTTDDTTAINNAYLATGAGGGAFIQFEALTYKFSQLTFTGAINLHLKGKHGGSVASQSDPSFAHATVLRSTTTSGNAIVFADAGYTSHRLVFEDIVFHAATVGYVATFANCAEIYFERCMVVNDGSGIANGLNFSRCYYVFNNGLMVLKGLNQRSSTSIGVNIDMAGAASWLGGLYNFRNCSLQSFTTGLSVGDPNVSAANENYASVNFVESELIANQNGASLQHGVKAARFDGSYIESNTNIGVWVTLESTAVSFTGTYFNNSTAGIADVLFGLNGAVNAQYKKFYNCLVDTCIFVGINIAGVRVNSTAGSSYVKVRNSNFTLGTAGALGVSCDTATACDIDDDNTFTGFAVGNDVNGSFLSTGTFTAAITGLTTSPTGTAYYKRRGQQVTMFVPGLSGTSNNVATTVTGLPSHLIPTRTQGAFGIAATDNGAVVNGYAQVNASGVINLYPSGAFGNWTNVNGKGFSSFNTTYLQS